MYEAYLLIYPGLDSISLVEEFVEGESIQETLLAKLGKLQKLLVTAIDGPKTSLHLGRISVLFRGYKLKTHVLNNCNTKTLTFWAS